MSCKIYEILNFMLAHSERLALRDNFLKAERLEFERILFNRAEHSIELFIFLFFYKAISVPSYWDFSIA